MTLFRSSPLFLGAPLLGALLNAGPASADSGQYPNVGMDYDATFQYDFTRADHSTPGTSRTTTDGYPDINATFYLRFSTDSQIHLTTELNPINPPNDGEDRFFEDVGLQVNELAYDYQSSRYSFSLGLVQVPIGRAQDAAPGLYTSDFVAVYDLDGMLGGTFAYRFFGDQLGVIETDLTLYRQDTSVLSRPYFQSGQQVDRNDGGPANNGKINSYAVAVNWLAIPALPFLELQAGQMRNQGGDFDGVDGSADDEVVNLASLRYIYAVPRSTDLDTTLSGQYLDVVPFIEYADVDNEGAIPGNDTRYLTTSLTLDYGLWAFGLTRTDKRRPNDTGGGDTHDYLNELSVTYALTGQLSIGVSAGTQKQDGENDNILGLAITYSGGY
ncbi:hypothetical protein [Metapseudomonas resinovorans]|uniref:Porin domain-containing protein n=1 Tax=Metapseudomonas resinovorans NBRC 106553 TaxID=1245471 RepID=S6AJR1_METRE|nr:hypothetical protein [Pseudomonas resinovorans]BAN48775.1 hypothetical protein PCA10_30430 [Pseudomonas resinovorans NBRC 106553]